MMIGFNGYSTKYTPFSACQVQPIGWLKNQLKIQAEGLNGNLDKVWPDVRDSQWIGGKAEGWERVPYWLDGFIPLAWLLDDEEKKILAKKYVDAILENQQEDGWICPCDPEDRDGYDVWVIFLICKVLVAYAECSKDERVENAVYKALYNLYRHIEKKTLFDWGLARWYECLIPIFWLYERYPEAWIKELAFMLRAQGMDYTYIYSHWPYTKPVEHGKWSQMTHVVNLGMALKIGALLPGMEDFNGEVYAQNAWKILQKYHGMACGHLSGDECLAGKSPLAGSECCSVVETMYSLELLLAASGNSFWEDLLEKYAFNALPATISPDMWTHQYVQQTNQIQCSILPDDHVPYTTNNKDANLFGLEPHYGCCTANFGQGFPKLALSAIMKSQAGFAITSILPVQVSAEHNGVHVKVSIITDYPFRDGYVVEVETQHPIEMELELRIPGFADEAWVDGKRVAVGQSFKLGGQWNGRRTINVAFEFKTRFQMCPDQLYCLWRGPLLFALAPKERWVKHEYVKDGVERKFPYCDYEVFPETSWNYGFGSGQGEIRWNTVGAYPFSPDGAPVELWMEMIPITWPIEHGMCTAAPKSCIPIGNGEVKRLIPYGCTNLRMTAMPRIKEA